MVWAIVDACLVTLAALIVAGVFGYDRYTRWRIEREWNRLRRERAEVERDMRALDGPRP